MTRSLFFTTAAAVVFVLLLSGSALAFYTWVDENGQTHVTDYPKPVPAEPAPVEAESVSAVPALPQPALKPDRPQSTGKSAVQPSSTAAPVPAPPKTERPVPPSPNPPPLTAVSSPTVTPAPLTAQPIREASPTAPQVIPLNTNAHAATMEDSGATRMAARRLTMVLSVLFFGYLYCSLCLYVIARKLNVSGAWIAWVPLFQIVTFLESASKPVWWVLLFFVPFVNLIVYVYLWMCISENVGRGKWLGLLMLVPFVSLIYPAILAFSGQGSNNDANVAAT